MSGPQVTKVVAVTGRYQWGTVTTHAVPDEPDQLCARSSDGSEVVVILSEGAATYAGHSAAAQYLIWREYRRGEVRRVAGPYWHPDHPGDVYQWARQ